jgi:hypothetical protein
MVISSGPVLGVVAADPHVASPTDGAPALPSLAPCSPLMDARWPQDSAAAPSPSMTSQGAAAAATASAGHPQRALEDEQGATIVTAIATEATAAATSLGAPSAPLTSGTGAGEGMVDEVVVEDVFSDDDEDEEAAAFTDSGVCAVQVPPPSPSSLQPTGGQSRWPSKPLSPLAAPFHPRGSSVGHSKARRWADTDPSTDSFDDEPTPAAARPSYLDAARKAIRAMSTPTPTAGAAIGMQRVTAMVPARGEQRRWRCQQRRRSSAPVAQATVPPPTQDAPPNSASGEGRCQRRKRHGCPFLVHGPPLRGHEHQGARDVVFGRLRVPVFQRLAPRRRILDPDDNGWRMVLSHGEEAQPCLAGTRSAARLVPQELVGRCFNYLGRDHVVAACRNHCSASGVGTKDTTCVGAGIGGAWPVDNLSAGLMVAMQWRLLMGVCRTLSAVAPADVDSGNRSESPTGAAAWMSLSSRVPPSSTLLRCCRA